MKHLVLLLVLAAAAPAAAQENKPIGIVAGTVGDVVLWRGGKAFRPNTGNALYAADEIETRAGAKARVLFGDESVLAMGPRTRIALANYGFDGETRKFALQVLAGRFKMAVAKYFLGKTDGRIETPTAVAGVRGTVVWGDTELDAVCALEGTVNLRAKTGDAAGTDLEAGACAAEMKAGKTTPISPSAGDLKKYLAEVTLP